MASFHQHKFSNVILLSQLLFKIVQAFVAIENPAVNTTIPVDEPYTITWMRSSDASASVFIELWIEAKLASNITTSTPDNGSYTWTPPLALKGKGDCFLAICPTNGNVENFLSCGYTVGGRFSIANTSSNNEVPSSTPTPSFNPNQQASSTSSPSSQTDHSSGLSTGTKVAIGILIPMFVIAVMVIIGLLIGRRRKIGQNTATSESDKSFFGSGYQMAELPGKSDMAELAAENERVHEFGNLRS